MSNLIKVKNKIVGGETQKGKEVRQYFIEVEKKLWRYKNELCEN